MFWALDYMFRLVGNFGVAILIVTVFIKIVFFPLANKSYASMAKMKNIQPEMVALRERFPDDKQKQQQEMMALYKREKINPVAGCLPILIQIPVFFALYKVLFVTIEMRHAPFYGWIKDLSAADPTNIFNLFGLIPYDPTLLPVFGPYLHLGVWPIVMGITMWVQMKLNPAPPDPTQKMIFDWMPLIFTFMLASFPAGLVIYWAWNNLLSVIQQGIIMKKNGAKIELFDNIKATFKKCDPQRIAACGEAGQQAGREGQGGQVEGLSRIAFAIRVENLTPAASVPRTRSPLPNGVRRGMLPAPPAHTPDAVNKTERHRMPAEIADRLHRTGAPRLRRRLAVHRGFRLARCAAADGRHGGGVRRPLQCRQVQPDQRADRPQRAGTHLAHAGADAGTDLLPGTAALGPAAGRHAGLRLRLGAEDEDRRLDRT